MAPFLIVTVVKYSLHYLYAGDLAVRYDPDIFKWSQDALKQLQFIVVMKVGKDKRGAGSHAGVRFGPVRHLFWVNLELDLRFGSAFFLNLNLKSVQVWFRSSSGLNQVQQNLLALLHLDDTDKKPS